MTLQQIAKLTLVVVYICYLLLGNVHWGSVAVVLVHCTARNEVGPGDWYV